MKLSELKNGAVVEMRNGIRYIKVDDTFLNLKMNGSFMPLPDYDDDLLYKSDKNEDSEWNIEEDRKLDIVKVNNNAVNNYGYLNLALCDVKENIWTWERPAEILDEVEKEYLKAICRPFKVKYIQKLNAGQGLELIRITVYSKLTNGEDDLILPYFQKGTMYTGMNTNERYMPEELGLE